MNKRVSLAGHVFISYVHEDSQYVDGLQRALEAANIPVWRDKSDLWPGEDWRQKIRRAITDNALVFIACFSSASVARSKSYQNEEITLAIEQLRQRRPEEPWLIPVRFDECDIPDIDLGAGRTLSAIQCADLFGSRYNEGIERLVAAISRLLGRPSSPRKSVRAATPFPIRSAESGQRRTRSRRIPAWALAVGLLVAVVCVSTALWLSIRSAPPATLAACASGASGPSVPAKIGTVATGSGEFVSVALSPDCQFLATGGNGAVELWRVADSRQVATLPSSSFGNMYELAFSHDGKVLAAAGQDGTVSLWDVANRRRIAILDATPNGATYCVSFSSVDDTVATGGSDGVARLWNAANGRQIGNEIITGSAVGALALSPNGKVLAVGGADGTDRLWDVTTRRQIAVLPGRQGHVFSVTFSPDSKTLAVGTYNGSVQWWNIATHKLIAALPSHNGSVTSVAFSPNGKILAAGGDGIVELIGANTHQRVTTLSFAAAGKAGKWSEGLAFSRNSAILAVGSDGGAQLWNVAGSTSESG